MNDGVHWDLGLAGSGVVYGGSPLVKPSSLRQDLVDGLGVSLAAGLLHTAPTKKPMSLGFAP